MPKVNLIQYGSGDGSGFGSGYGSGSGKVLANTHRGYLK